MNRIIITGRITKNPELKVTNSGTEVCNFTVAVDRRAKKDQEKQTDFFTCTSFGKSASFMEHYFKKGDGITIEGRMESRKWADNDGNNHIAWNVIVDNIEFPFSNSKHENGKEIGFTEANDISDSDFPF